MSTTISQTDQQAGHESGAPDDDFTIDVDQGDVDQGAAHEGDASPEQMHEPAVPVVVRRNAGFAALVGAAASAIAIADAVAPTRAAKPALRRTTTGATGSCICSGRASP